MAQPRDAGGKFLPFAPPGESANVMQPMKEFTNALKGFTSGIAKASTSPITGVGAAVGGLARGVGAAADVTKSRRAQANLDSESMKIHFHHLTRDVFWKIITQLLIT